ncbi:MAG: hypothetical protein LBD94_03625 [Rickettsiales bacterium]|jgi:hypothetical protein|nr:hypothetical protein [Rickettsiales bacterium]
MNCKSNNLSGYIEDSELRKIDDSFFARMSKGLAAKWDKGLYVNGVRNLQSHISEINSLDIRYPSNARPNFYLYIVPDENFIELLNFPFKDAKRGGKPVSIFDLDGFNSAYGCSQNTLENAPDAIEGIAQKVNGIHEFAHLVHGQFFNRDRILSEGFAEALPLYILDYEKKFDEHREIIKSTTAGQIFSAAELIKMGRDRSFGMVTRIRHKTCSFDWSYISSYLFVRACLNIIESKFNFDKRTAAQKFLEIVRASQYSGEWLIVDLAQSIGANADILLNKKSYQLGQIERIRSESES